MENTEFAAFRKGLRKTQKELAQLLGTSIKAVHSYEQGWRGVPPNVERQLLFLISRKRRPGEKIRPCWTQKKCPPSRKHKCPAWEFQAGKFCWFVNGTICGGVARKNWNDKMRICKNCPVFEPLLCPDSKPY